jgi:23S rRNA (cytidine1920-2'-O)/16S rRNA (cytidine1409-2'-O)-methyltransferase
LRLDNYLVEQNLAKSRTKAQNYIKEAQVLVDGEVVTKPSFDVTTQEVKLKEFKDYVSRAAFKLAYFLEEIDLDLKDKECLDIGSSTGGFSEVLLENGVKSVVCVDVGKEQLHPKIKNDARVTVFEQTDIREFESKPFDVVVSDVSFISLLKILDKVDELSSKDIVLLFKPQFEVGITAKRDKKGVVKDKKAIELAKARFEDAATLLGWKLLHKAPSKISGKDGNLEYCYYFYK